MIATPTPIFIKALETGDVSYFENHMVSIIAEGIISVGKVLDYTDSTSRGISAVTTDISSANEIGLDST